MAFAPTKENAERMIKIYNWSIDVLTDISPYGPPTKHIYYWQKCSGETREESLLADLARLDYWEQVLATFH